MRILRELILRVFIRRFYAGIMVFFVLGSRSRGSFKVIRCGRGGVRWVSEGFGDSFSSRRFFFSADSGVLRVRRSVIVAFLGYRVVRIG